MEDLEQLASETPAFESVEQDQETSASPAFSPVAEENPTHFAPAVPDDVDLRDLDADERREWQLTGKLPADISERERPEPSIQKTDKDQDTLASLTDEQLELWRKTGELPEETRKADPGTAGREKDGGQETSVAKHEAAVETLPDRLMADVAQSDDFHQVVVEGAEQIMLPTSLVEFLHHTLADLENAPAVFRHLATNPQQTLDLVRMSATGVLHAVHGISSRLEGNGQNRRRVTQAPPPPHEVSGNGRTSSDEVEQALKEEDFNAYAGAANRSTRGNAWPCAWHGG